MRRRPSIQSISTVFCRGNEHGEQQGGANSCVGSRFLIRGLDDKAAGKGYVHKKKAARLKSRLAHRMKGLKK